VKGGQSINNQCLSITARLNRSSEPLSRTFRSRSGLTIRGDGLNRYASGTPIETALGTNVFLEYKRDYAGRLSSVTDQPGTSARLFAYQHVFGQLDKVIFPDNRLTTDYDYDARGLMKKITHTGSFGTRTWDYLRDFNGTRRKTTEPAGGQTRTLWHQYDQATRLVREDLSGTTSYIGKIDYEHDEAGNRKRRWLTGADSTMTALMTSADLSYSFDAQDQLTAAGADLPQWDGRGNMTRTSATSAVMSYDRRNRLMKYNGTAVVLAYDEQGNRVSKTVGSTKTVYLVDTVNPTGYAQVLAEFTVSGSTVEFQKGYVYGHRLLGERLPAVESAAAEYKYYAADVLGSTRFTVQGSNGAVGTEYAYEAYGKLLGTEPATGSAYLYTGEQWDGDVQAYYLRARWYLPAIGRFTSRDTYNGSLEDPISRNKYLYAHANPVNLADPSGQSAIGDVVLSISIRVYLFAQTHATIINAARVGLTTLTLGLVAADSAGLLTSDRSIVGIYLSSGGNPFAEATYVIGEIRTLRTAIVAARTVPSAIQGFTQAETAVINEARQILNSSEFAQLKAAKEAGRSRRVTINGRTIQYEAGAPWSGFTWAEQRGFVLGDEAFTSEAELTKTVLHELHRLKIGTIVPGGSISVTSPTAKETLDAYQFAEKAAKVL
jgi:RHS repeat-associated protein